MAGIIDIKAKPSPPSELIIGPYSCVSWSNELRYLIWPRLDALGLPNKLWQQQKILAISKILRHRENARLKE